MFPIAERRESLSNKDRGYAMLAKDVMRRVVLMKIVRLLCRLLCSLSLALVCCLGLLYSFSMEGIRAQMVSVVG